MGATAYWQCRRPERAPAKPPVSSWLMPLRTAERINELGAWALDHQGARAKWRRRRWLRRSSRMTPVVMADMQGARILVRTDDPFVSAAVFSEGSYADAGELEAAVRTLRTNGYSERLDNRGIFLDVGANIGTATVSALARQGFDKAVAIEPEPGNLSLLRANVALNGFHERVRVIAAAVGAQDGQVELLVNRENPGDHRVATGSASAASGQSVSVPLRSIDSLVASGELEPSRVGLLWIDVQGFEAEVLRGASTIIEAGVPTVIEYAPEHMASELGALRELIASRFALVGDLREARTGTAITLRPASEIAEVRPAGRFTDLLLLPPS